MSFRPFLRARRRLLVVPLCAAATLGSATFAAADTRVSIQNGPFASGLDGRHVLIRDINSVTHNEPLDVTATRDGNTLIVRDDAGDEVPGDGCTELGGTVRCSLTGVLGLRFEGSQLNDVLTNATSLLANYHAGPGHDLLEGGSGRDEMAGNDGNDTMNGGEGNDVFTASETTNDGADIVRGQGGTDTMRYGLSEDPIFVSLNGVADDEEGDNIDTENLSGSRFGDTIVGSDAANALSGGDGNDNIQGGNGDDTINGGRGADAMHGQAGADVVTYADQTAPVEVTFDDIGNDGNANDGSGDKVANTVETVLGGAGDDELSAADAGPVAKRLVGNGGADALDGGPGPDRLEGGPGEDRLDGGGADDTVFGGDDADEIRDFSGGNDTMDGQGGDDSVNGGSGADTMLGGPGADHLRGAAGNDTLDGGSGEDLVSGDTDDDTVRGGADADTVQGETGNDIVEGGPGNDKLDGYEGADVLDGGADNDSVTFVSTGNVTVTLDNGLADDGGTSDQVNGVGDEVRLVEKVFTGPADDILIGDDDAETLSAGEGDDIIEGNGGADTLIGGRGADELTGGPGIDAMSGNEGDDRLFARDGERDEPIACGEDIGDLDADLLEADLADVFSETVADCETVELP